MKRTLILLIGLFVGISSVVMGAEAADSRWQPAGFGGAGNILSVHIDPSQPGVVYATSDVGGVFRSTDYGTRWESRNQGLGNYEVSSFAIDPFDPNTLYAGVGAFASSSKAGMYISNDAGLTWRHLSSTADKGINFRMRRTPDAIAPDPFTRGTILSGSRAKGVWRSIDSGESWTQVLSPRRTNAPFLSYSAGGVFDDPRDGSYPAPVSVIEFDPARAGVVYAGHYGDGIFKSVEGGIKGSWRPANEGLPPEAIVTDIAVGREGVLYAALGPEGVYRSDDGAERWRPMNSSLPLADIRIHSVAVDPADNRVAYFAQEFIPGGWRQYEPIWKTSDGGRTWAETGKFSYDRKNDPTAGWRFYPRAAWDIAVEPNGTGRMLFAESWGVGRSLDGGRRWHEVNAGLQNTCVADLAIDVSDGPDRPEVLYAAHLDAGLLASADGGASWRALLPNREADRDEFGGHFWFISITGQGDQKRYFIGTAPWFKGVNRVLRSSDGRRWQKVFEAPIAKGGRGLGEFQFAIHPGQPSRLYLIQDGGKLLTSSDGGDTWQPTSGQPQAKWFNDVLIDGQGRIFIASHSNGLWRSVDAGATWQRLLPQFFRFLDLEISGDAIYAAANDGNLYRTEDGGDRWERVTDFTDGKDSDGNGQEGVSVAVDPRNPDHIIFGRSDIWHYADLGTGLFESWDRGITWTPRSEGLGMPRLGKAVFDSAGRIFAGTFCGGIWRLDPSAPSE